MPDERGAPPPSAERIEEELPQPSPGWTDRGGMVEQQASANEWFKVSSDRLQEQARQPERSDDAGNANDGPEKEMTDAQQARLDRLLGSMTREAGHEMSRDPGRDRGDE